MERFKGEVKSVFHNKNGEGREEEKQNDENTATNNVLEDLADLQFTLNDIDHRKSWAKYSYAPEDHSERIISSMSNLSFPLSDSDSNQVELVWKSGLKKVAHIADYLRPRAPSKLQEEVQSILHRYRTLAFILLICMLPIYCFAQLFLSLRDQVLIVLWRNIVIDNSSLRLKLDYRQDMIMKSRGFGFYRNQDLSYILYRISRRYYILFFNIVTLFIGSVLGDYYISLDKTIQGVNASLFAVLQLIAYFFIAYINLLSKRKTRGDIYDYLNKYHSLQYVNIIDSDHTEFKSLHEIKEDILSYGYVFLTTANQGYFILATRDLQDLDIHDLVSERLLRNDQEIMFIKIKNPYNYIVLSKTRLYITVFKEPWSLKNILGREVNADIMIMDMKIYNMISIFFLMLYYLTSFDIEDGLFFLVFVGLIVIFFGIFCLRIRRYMNIQFRMVQANDDFEIPTRKSTEETDEEQQGLLHRQQQGGNASGNRGGGVGSSSKYHFIDLLYLEKKGKQKNLNPWWKIQQKTFFTIFHGTILEGRVSDILLRCIQDVNYYCWEVGLEFNDFIKYIDHLSNINGIGIKIISKDFLLYSNIEEINLNKVIIYENGSLRLEEMKNIDFLHLKLASKEQFESFKGQRIH